MKLRGDADQVLTIERSGFGEPGTPADDDLLFNVTIVVGGYSAADQAWVADLQQIRRDFENLTASAGGDYDGWGTPVVK